MVALGGGGLFLMSEVPLYRHPMNICGARSQVRETLSILDLDYVSLPCPLEDPLAETRS